MPCTNELYGLATGPECGREWSEERLEGFKGSLIKYMEEQRRGITRAKGNCLKRALIKMRVCVPVCIQLSVHCYLCYCVYCSEYENLFTTYSVVCAICFVDDC